MASLLDELLLLAHDDTSGRNRAGSIVEIALGGAIALELALAERITVADGKINVIDSAPLGDPVLDEALAAIADDKPRKPKDVVQRVAKRRLTKVRDDMVERGLLLHRRDKAAGLFPVSRYLPQDSAAAADARTRLRAAVDAEHAPDARTAALSSLVYAMNMEKLALPDRKPRAVRRALKAIVGGSWTSESSGTGGRETQGALMTAIAGAVGDAHAAAAG